MHLLRNIFQRDQIRHIFLIDNALYHARQLSCLRYRFLLRAALLHKQFKNSHKKIQLPLQRRIVKHIHIMIIMLIHQLLRVDIVAVDLPRHREQDFHTDSVHIVDIHISISLFRRIAEQIKNA